MPRSLRDSEYYGSMSAGSIVGATRGTLLSSNCGSAVGGSQGRAANHAAAQVATTRMAGRRGGARLGRMPPSRPEQFCRANLCPVRDACQNPRVAWPTERWGLRLQARHKLSLAPGPTRSVWLVCTANALTVYDGASRRARLATFATRQPCGGGEGSAAAATATHPRCRRDCHRRWCAQRRRRQQQQHSRAAAVAMRAPRAVAAASVAAASVAAASAVVASAQPASAQPARPSPSTAPGFGLVLGFHAELPATSRPPPAAPRDRGRPPRVHVLPLPEPRKAAPVDAGAAAGGRPEAPHHGPLRSPDSGAVAA